MAGMVVEAAIGIEGEGRRRLRAGSLVSGQEKLDHENANRTERPVVDDNRSEKHNHHEQVAKLTITTTMAPIDPSSTRGSRRTSVLPTVPESSCSSIEEEKSRRKIFPTFKANHWVWTKADPNQTGGTSHHHQQNVKHQFQNHLLLSPLPLTPLSEMQLFDPLSELPELPSLPQLGKDLDTKIEIPKDPKRLKQPQQPKPPPPKPLPVLFLQQIPTRQPEVKPKQQSKPQSKPRQQQTQPTVQNLFKGSRPISVADDADIRYGERTPILPSGSANMPARHHRHHHHHQKQRSPTRDMSLSTPLTSAGSLSPHQENDPSLLPSTAGNSSPTSVQATALSGAALAARKTSASIQSTTITNANTAISSKLVLPSPMPVKATFFKAKANNGIMGGLPKLLPNLLSQRTVSAPSPRTVASLPVPPHQKPQRRTSLLKPNPKYSALVAPPQLIKNESSSLPSLVSLKESEDDSHSSSTDRDNGGERSSSACSSDRPADEKPSDHSDKNESEGAAAHDDHDDNNSQPQPVSEQEMATAENELVVDTTPDSPPIVLRKVMFDPRIWIREFQRSAEEEACIWYSNDDMDRFKRLALDRILRYQSPADIVPTGTGRMVQRSTEQWKGPIYSHAALTLDGENEHDDYMRKKVMEKELQTILIVDPHDVCLKLFSKAFQCVLPRTARIVTAKSSGSALKELQQGHRFDVVIVEERLQLYHKNSMSSSSSSDSSDNGDSDRADEEAAEECECGYENLSSGAALIESLAASPVTSTSVFIGVSARLEHDRHKLQKCGADYLWSKPPPPVDQALLEELLKTVLIKRGRTILATELFGGN